MTNWHVRAVDYHTEGEPFRIVEHPPVDFLGDTVAGRREFAATDARTNALRTFLALEPRGFDGMYGGFIVPPDDDGAHFGVLFWHKDGFSVACGHGSIALARWALDTGRVTLDPSGRAEVVIDVPAGRIRVALERSDDGAVVSHYIGMPVRSVEIGRRVDTPFGAVTVDTVEQGHHLIAVDVADAAVDVTVDELPRLKELFRHLCGLAEAEGWPAAGVGIAMLYRRLDVDGDTVRQRGVAIYGAGQVDRSPCGTGTAGLTALLGFAGLIADGRGELVEESLLGVPFVGTIVNDHERDGFVLPRVAGRAFRAGEHRFVLDANDPFPAGLTISPY